MPWPDRTKSVSLFQKSVSRSKSLPSKIVEIATIFGLRTDPVYRTLQDCFTPWCPRSLWHAQASPEPTEPRGRHSSGLPCQSVSHPNDSPVASTRGKVFTHCRRMTTDQRCDLFSGQRRSAASGPHDRRPQRCALQRLRNAGHNSRVCPPTTIHRRRRNVACPEECGWGAGRAGGRTPVVGVRPPAGCFVGR